MYPRNALAIFCGGERIKPSKSSESALALGADKPLGEGPLGVLLSEDPEDDWPPQLTTLQGSKLCSEELLSNNGKEVYLSASKVQGKWSEYRNIRNIEPGNYFDFLWSCF